MRVTLPDGRPFTLRYAEALDLAARGYRSTVSATLSPGGDIRSSLLRNLAVLHTTAAEHSRGLAPTATYPDADGRPVPYYVDPVSPERSGLAVQIGSWLVVVPDSDDPVNAPDEHLTPDQLALWAHDLSGWVDSDGFLVLAPGRAVTLDQSAKVSFVLGPTSKRSGSVSIGERWLCEGPGTDGTTPRRFPMTPSGTNQGAAWCDRATGLHVTVTGPERFVDRAAASFRMMPFSTAGRATEIRVARRTVESGASIPGVVVVVNNTGAPLTYEGCGAPFGIALTQGGATPEIPRLACLMRFTVPRGETAYPASVSAAAPTCSTGPVCPLDPGRFSATFWQNGSDFPPARSIPVKVLPART